MKVKGRLLILTLLCFCSINYLVAQQNRFIGGVLLNINGIEFNGDEAQYWNSTNKTIRIVGTIGFSAGAFVKLDFAKKLYSSLELRYSRKGSIYEFISSYGMRAYETVYLNYVEVPLLLGYKIRPSKRTFYFEGGLSFAKLISSKIEVGDPANRTGTPNAKDFKNTDLAWIIGLKFPLIKKWNEKLLFGLRVSHSILPIHKSYKIYNCDYGIEFSYAFD